MDGEESDEDEEGLLLPRQVTGHENGGISIRDTNRTTDRLSTQYRRSDPLDPINHHLARIYPRSELRDHGQQYSPNNDCPRSIDWYSLQQDAAESMSIPIQIPSGNVAIDTERGPHTCTTETSPKGSPGAKREEFVPNSKFDPLSPALQYRVYTAKDINLTTFHGRLATFTVFGWDHPFMNKRILAEAGFFYKGEGDEVICALCGKSLLGWCEGDDPWEQHKDNFGEECFRRS